MIDDQCAPSLTAAMLNHFKSVKMKKLGDEDEEANVSVHHQCLVTRQCNIMSHQKIPTELFIWNGNVSLETNIH